MIAERIRRALIVGAIQGDEPPERVLRLFFPKLDADWALQRIRDAAAIWQDDRYQAEQIIADIIEHDKEAKP